MVWSALTESDRLVEWLAPGEIDLRPGGRAVLRFTNSNHVVDSTVTTVDPPRLLEYGWIVEGDDFGFVRWELSPENDGTRLVLIHTVPDATSSFGPSALAGWQTHLDQLAAALEGHPISWSRDYWQVLYDQYERTWG
jgi:uncharacterized protein YndB with AHSA1/START domain